MYAQRYIGDHIWTKINFWLCALNHVSNVYNRSHTLIVSDRIYGGNLYQQNV